MSKQVENLTMNWPRLNQTFVFNISLLLGEVRELLDQLLLLLKAVQVFLTNYTKISNKMIFHLDEDEILHLCNISSKKKRKKEYVAFSP